MSHTASESLPPDTATSTRSVGAIISNSSMAFCVWSRQNFRKWGAQKLELWRRRSMTAGSRHTVHFTPASSCETAGDDGADLDHVGVVEHRVAGDQFAVADEQHGFA